MECLCGQQSNFEFYITQHVNIVSIINYVYVHVYMLQLY